MQRQHMVIRYGRPSVAKAARYLHHWTAVLLRFCQHNMLFKRICYSPLDHNHVNKAASFRQPSLSFDSLIFHLHWTISIVLKAYGPNSSSTMASRSKNNELEVCLSMLIILAPTLGQRLKFTHRSIIRLP